ncbi:hypothetical protein TcWFU_007992 [Taenia crassiceps]|uniref:Uncharacterized protein n=1 Tax=Taenia crassiceps TaxID=6207 RepID=A0ABR4Q5S4_9CEST
MASRLEENGKRMKRETIVTVRWAKLRRRPTPLDTAIPRNTKEALPCYSLSHICVPVLSAQSFCVPEHILVTPTPPCAGKSADVSAATGGERAPLQKCVSCPTLIFTKWQRSKLCELCMAKMKFRVNTGTGNRIYPKLPIIRIPRVELDRRFQPSCLQVLLYA